MKTVDPRPRTRSRTRTRTDSRSRTRALLAALALGALLLPSVSFGVSSPALAAPGDAVPGQSSEPAPPSREKRVIGNVHTDTVSAFLDDGRLVLDSKADVDGVLGKRFVAGATLFHLSGDSRRELPANPMFGFIGAPGSEVWLAPQTQNPALIWPGFSTEHLPLREALGEGQLAVRMLSASGPGSVEVYLLGDDVERIFSSTTSLPDWQMHGGQHTHMNWAFTAPGTYVLIFEMETVIGGGAQRAQAAYTFVVGELAAHTIATTTSLVASAAQVDPGDALMLTATVSPAAGSRAPSAPLAGAVQFRDLASDAILGHAPLGADGSAAFVTDALLPGAHRLVAEFVPAWVPDEAPSQSAETTVTVTGVQIPEPEHDDGEPASEEAVAAIVAGTSVLVTSPEKSVARGGVLRAHISAGEARDAELRGDWVSVWMYGPAPVLEPAPEPTPEPGPEPEAPEPGPEPGEPGDELPDPELPDEPVETPPADASWLGWVQLDYAGELIVRIPAEASVGAHRLVIKDRAGDLIGWDVFTATETVDPGPVDPPPGTEPEPPAPAPETPVAECLPAVTLEYGHIDAFAVSAAGGMAVLQLLEDVTGSRVLREAETVLLRVKEQAYASIPAGVPGGSAGYVLPLAQNPGLIWPGWDTNRTAMSGYSDVSINILGVSGPGQVYLYTSAGSFGGWRPLLTHGGYGLPGTIHESSPAHTHAQWVFSQAGVYVLAVNAVATNPGTGASLTTATHRYVFQVGDVPLGDVFCSMSAHGAGASAMVDAAVKQAALDAAAAEQEAAEEREKESKTVPKAGGSSAASTVASGDTSPDALSSRVVVAVIGGGVLAAAGIVVGTLWLLRRGRSAQTSGSV